MVNNDILDLYTKRRELMYMLMQEIKTKTMGIDEIDQLNTYDIIEKMSELTDLITNECDKDYPLVDLYRQLSLSISNEDYESAVNLRDDINSYK